MSDTTIKLIRGELNSADPDIVDSPPGLVGYFIRQGYKALETAQPELVRTVNVVRFHVTHKTRPEAMEGIRRQNNSPLVMKGHMRKEPILSECSIRSERKAVPENELNYFLRSGYLADEPGMVTLKRKQYGLQPEYIAAHTEDADRLLAEGWQIATEPFERCAAPFDTPWVHGEPTAKQYKHREYPGSRAPQQRKQFELWADEECYWRLSPADRQKERDDLVAIKGLRETGVCPLCTEESNA